MVKHRLTIQAGLCLVGCLQLIAFTSLLFQLPYLYGRQGVQPVSTALDSAQAVQQQLQLSGGGISLPPSLIWFHDVLGFTAEAMLVAICTTGWLLAATAACGAAHPLVFTALWLLYLSFVSLGGSFIEYGDEVLLELSFAAIWLAMAHSCNKNAHQQQQQEAATGQLPHLPGLNQHPQPSQRLSGMAVLLCKWLLFRLLLVTSTFSATLVCGRDPVLASCFKTLVAHGQPHATTRWLQMLPAPLAAAGTAVMLLELPAAFLVLLYVPALQHATAVALLALQLLRISWGPAGMANLAAAVLSFMLLDEARWVPVVLKLARVLGLTAGQGSSMQVEGGQQQLDNAARPALSRSSSVTSMVSVGVAEEGANSRELGPSILDSFNWVLPATLAAVVLCMGLMLGYDTQLGLLLRPSPHQLYRALQLAVPLATLAWAVTAAVASWKAVAVSWSACKADAAAPKAAAGLEPEPEPQAAAATVQHPPAARSPEPHANGSGLANGYYSPGAERPGRYLHFLGLTPPRAADVAAALLRAAEEAPADGMDEPVEPVANGDAAAHAAANDGAAAGPSKAAPTRGRATRGRGGRAGGRAAAKAASAEQQAALTATAGAKHQGAGEAFAGLVADPKAAPGGPPAAAAAANGNAAVAALGGDAAEAAEAVPQAAAVASRRRARKSVLGVWAPAVCAVAAAAALLVVFVAGAPQLLMAVNYSQAAIRHFVPGPILRASQLGRSFGVASGSSSCRDAFLATQQAAAASGPGALVHFEPFVLDEAAGSWKKVPLQYSLGSSQLRRARSSWWRGLLGARGWFQTRLQAKMAAAAAAAAAGAEQEEEEVEPWLVVLANKIVEGSSDLVGLLDRPARPYDYVTIGRVAYRPGDADWHTDTAGHTPAVQTQPRGSVYLWSFTQSFKAAPGYDGWLVAFVEAIARSLSGPVVLAGLLLAVVMRHLLLPGGLLQECQRAVLT